MSTLGKKIEVGRGIRVYGGEASGDARHDTDVTREEPHTWKKIELERSRPSAREVAHAVHEMKPGF
jgi:hypothetical protein